MSQTTTRPAGEGTGIDLSGIDVEAAIFKATGGGYGAPQGGTTTDPALLPAPVRDGTWVAGDGRTPDVTGPLDGADPSTVTDPLRDISLTTDPIAPNNAPAPLLPETQEFHFANGGPAGAASWGLVIGAAVVIGGVVAYNVSDGFKNAVDDAGKAIANAFDKLFSGDDDAAADPGKSLEGMDKKANDEWKKANSAGGSNNQYLTNPDADQQGPVDDGAVLRQAFGDLLGAGNTAGLALDVEGFLKGGSVLDAMNAGKGAALGDIMAGFGRFGIDAKDGLDANEIGRMAEALGLGDLFGTTLLGPPDEMTRLLLDAREVEALFTASGNEFTLVLRDDWW